MCFKHVLDSPVTHPPQVPEVNVFFEHPKWDKHGNRVKLNGYEMFGPYSMAIIKLDEGPHITSQIVDCDPEIIKPGMKVKSVFRKLGEDSESGILHYGTKFVLLDNSDNEETEEDNIENVEL